LLKFELNLKYVYVQGSIAEIGFALYSCQPAIQPPKSPETMPACQRCSPLIVY